MGYEYNRTSNKTAKLRLLDNVKRLFGGFNQIKILYFWFVDNFVRMSVMGSDQEGMGSSESVQYILYTGYRKVRKIRRGNVKMVERSISCFVSTWLTLYLQLLLKQITVLIFFSSVSIRFHWHTTNYFSFTKANYDVIS